MFVFLFYCTGACQIKLTKEAARAQGSFFFTEIRAGLATFFAMAYIISVNATITSDSGGTCICPPESQADLCNSNTAYLLCVQEVNRDIVTATAAIAALGTFFMGLLANLPAALAPGMGLNAYFAYTVVGYHGSGMIPYRVALTAVFVEGFVFLGLTLLGIRQWLARALPASIKLATGTGIGLYLTLIGLTYNAGIGLVTGAVDTPMEPAGCVSTLRDPTTGLCPNSAKMRNPTMWIGIFCGGVLTACLMLYRVKGAIIIGILLVSVISWPHPTPVTYFPHTELGDSMFDFFKKVVAFHPITHTLAAQDWSISGHGGQFGLAFITFLYVDILDTTGTLYSMARFAGALDEGTQDFEGSALAYVSFLFRFLTSFTELTNLDGRCYLRLDWLPLRHAPGIRLHRERRWNLRRRHDGPDFLCNRSLLLRRNLFRAHIRIHSTLGNRLHPGDSGSVDVQGGRRNQLAVLWRCYSGIPDYCNNALHVQHRVRADCRHPKLHCAERDCVAD
jgi:xanthine/uracil/vitamin C permease (AzgA family)